MIYIIHCLTRQQTVPNCPFKVFQRALKKLKKSLRVILFGIIYRILFWALLKMVHWVSIVTYSKKGLRLWRQVQNFQFCLVIKNLEKIPRLMSDFKWDPAGWSLEIDLCWPSYTRTGMTRPYQLMSHQWWPAVWTGLIHHVSYMKCYKLFTVVPKDVKLVWKRKSQHRWQIFANEFDQFLKLLRSWRKNQIKNWRNRRKIWPVYSVLFQKKNQVQSIRVHVIHQLTIFLIWTNSKMKLIKSKKRTKLYEKCKLSICKYRKLVLNAPFHTDATLIALATTYHL